MTCNQLADIAINSELPSEAEGWFKRALELDELVQAGSPSNAKHLNNLAHLLVNEVQAGRIPKPRLIEARSYAERALEIRESLDDSSEIWQTLSTLSRISDMEGQTANARNYRRREREAFAAFEGNRYHIDRQHGQLIAAIAAAARGDEQAREAVEEVLPELEKRGWKIADAIHLICAGERDWHTLADGLHREVALLVLRVLETIEQPPMQDTSPEQVIASLPASIREALEQGDQAAFRQAFEALSPEEQQVVMEAMQYLQAQQEEAEEEEDEEGGEE